ncbi:hypothetical protein A4E84_36350 [Streptomyces qaidamensis]|uniref:Uncharacterized protein n=1 Tax=Streptomyces qaidamensis TaxID=1783515 RepID=A0A143CBN4_9ACTN|nr:hypothetical protein [Streptomyces qaidamensis]AMW14480.1 hypothetical protein A4E84_36350 [Streptomyces qaidamensis]
MAAELRAFWLANYQLCGTATNDADYRGSWHYSDPDVGAWCGLLAGTGSDTTFPAARPQHETVVLPPDGRASGQAVIHGGGAYFVDLVGDRAAVWNFAVKAFQGAGGQLHATVVAWDLLPRRCGPDAGIPSPSPAPPLGSVGSAARGRRNR